MKKYPSEKQRGLTLGETLVSMSLLIIISMLCLGIFTSAWRRVHITNAIRDIQENAVVALDSVTRDLRETSFSALINNTAPPAVLSPPLETAYAPLQPARPRVAYYCYLLFPISRNLDGAPLQVNYQPDWKSWVLFYLFPDPADARLSYLARKQVAGVIGSPPDPLTHVTSISGARIVARNLTSLRVINAPGLMSTLELSIGTCQWVRGRECTFSLKRPVRISNP